MIILLALSAALTGCHRQEMVQPDTEEDLHLVKCRFTTGVRDETKSILTSEGVETRITDLMIAVYRDGELFSRRYWESAPESLELLLQERVNFTIYAWANMGDYTCALPYDEQGMEELEYTIPSYESVNTKGFPMASYISFTPGVSRQSSIILERLFAKVSVNLDCMWPGGKIVSARVGNLNRKLRPFGASAIAVPSQDLYSGTQECEIIGRHSASIVLFVPENLQGCVAGIYSPDDKTQDHTPQLEQIKDRLTYLEVEVSGDGLYQGSITYRNYLGDNATDSFDIRRNTSYTWNIEYYEDNLSRDEWKYENDLTDTRYLSTETHIYVIPGQMVSLGDYLDSNMNPQTLRWEPVLQSNLGTIIQGMMNHSNLSLPSFIVKPLAPAGSAFWAVITPQNNSVEGLRRELAVNVRIPLRLEMNLVGETGAYPYQTARFKSASVLTSDKAVSLSDNLNLEITPEVLLEGFRGWDYGNDTDGYYLLFHTVPTMPGNYHCTVVNSTEIDWIDLTVHEPQICFSREKIYLDTRGYDSPVTLTLCDMDGEVLQDGIYYSECTMEFNVEPAYRPYVHIGLTSDGGYGYSTTLKNYSIIFNGPKNMAGTVIPATARYTFPNGYSVSNTISIQIVPS